MLQEDEKSGNVVQEIVSEDSLEAEKRLETPDLMDLGRETDHMVGNTKQADHLDTLTHRDSGKEVLYREISTKFPFKTSDRLLDDLIHDLAFINSKDHDILYSDLHNGILKAPVLAYSRRISQLYPYSFGTLVDQITLQTSLMFTWEC